MEAGYNKSDVDAAIMFLENRPWNVKKIKYPWCSANAVKVGLAIKSWKPVDEKDEIRRRYLSKETGLSLSYIDSSISELRHSSLIKPTLPYEVTEFFDPYMSKLIEIAKTAKLVMHLES